MTQINYRAEPEMNRALKANSATRRPTRNWRPRALDEFQGRRLSSFPCSQVHRDALGGHDRDVVYPTNQVNGMGFLRVRTPHDLTSTIALTCGFQHQALSTLGSLQRTVASLAYVSRANSR